MLPINMIAIVAVPVTDNTGISFDYKMEYYFNMFRIYCCDYKENNLESNCKSIRLHPPRRKYHQFKEIKSIVSSQYRTPCINNKKTCVIFYIISDPNINNIYIISNNLQKYCLFSLPFLSEELEYTKGLIRIR